MINATLGSGVSENVGKCRRTLDVVTFPHCKELHMSSFKRIAAGASALVLASGAALVGAGVAGAQGSSEIAADLELAATALNGPVTVAPNAEGGPTVTYTNETGEAETCIGLAMPYASVDEVGLDPSAGGAFDLLPQIIEIENMGGVSILSATDEGAPTAFDAVLPSAGVGNVGGAVLLLANNDIRTGVPVADGDTIAWEATAPEEPAAAAVLCMPDSVTDNGARIAAMATNFGIDPQVVADQINDRLGPLGSIGAGSVSGGSVGMGANVLGSLGGGDETENEESDGSSMMSSGVSEAGSGNDDEDGELPAATLVN